jgi:hypothetical protein
MNKLIGRLIRWYVLKEGECSKCLTKDNHCTCCCPYGKYAWETESYFCLPRSFNGHIREKEETLINAIFGNTCK